MNIQNLLQKQRSRRCPIRPQKIIKDKLKKKLPKSQNI